MVASRKEWDCEGYKCLIIRHSTMGHLCGYVGLPKEHPWYGKIYSNCLQGCRGRKTKFETLNKMGHRHYSCDHDTIERLINVHGGVTFSQKGDGKNWPKGYWWIGFDCAHLGDLVTGFSPHEGDIYRDYAYVTQETELLAQQLARQVIT